MTATKNIVFTIYDENGVNIWSETQAVSIEAGLYTVQLGSNISIPLGTFGGDIRYLGITVDGTELSPRVVMVSVPYAYRAGIADSTTVGSFENSAASGIGVYGMASYTTGLNHGGLFISQGDQGRGVYGRANNTSGGPNYGGYFWSDGLSGIGAYGRSTGVGGIGVYGHASNTIGGGRGGYFETNAEAGSAIWGRSFRDSAYSGYFEGGAGVVVAGSAEVTKDLKLSTQQDPPLDPNAPAGTIRWGLQGSKFYIFLKKGAAGTDWVRATMEAVP